MSGSDPFAALRASLRHLACGPSWVIGLTSTVLCVCWILWGVAVKVSLRVESQHALVSQSSSIFHVDARRPGIVQSVGDLRPGRRVKKGDLLLELETSRVEIEVDAVRHRIANLGIARKALVDQLEVEENGLRALQKARESEHDLNRAKLTRAKVILSASTKEMSRSDALAEIGFFSQREGDKARMKQALAQTDVTLRKRQMSHDSRVWESEQARRQADIAAISHKIAENDLERGRQSAELKRLLNEKRQHRIIAPGHGMLGAVNNVRVGSMLKSGQRVASIVSTSTLHIDSKFPSASAFGRIKVGQEARVRLLGFPWTRFGQLSARVTQVASEAVQEQVDVQLEITQVPGDFVVVHGQPAKVAIAVESATPWSIVMRYVGQRVR